MTGTRFSDTVEWLLAGAPGVNRPDHMLQRMCDRLVAAGLPIHHVNAFVTTLHPRIAGRRFTWTPDEPVLVAEIPYGFAESDTFLNEHVRRVLDTRKPVRLRGTHDVEDTEIARQLRERSITDYCIYPLHFTIGETHAIAYATPRENGFTDDEIAGLDRIQDPLARMVEIYAFRRTATNLLNTYVGHNAGAHILSGRIKRGDTQVIRAAILFSDLRDFTTYAYRYGEEKLIARLNRYFDRVVPEIERNGGEVLKYMGDGLLAIFAVDNEPREACRQALDAARAAHATEVDPEDDPDMPIAFGMALHYGDIVYGNIGASDRLDFTVIGRAVNYAARMEGIAGKKRIPIVASDVFLKHADTPAASLGTFPLKGIEEPQELFTLID